MTLLVSSCKNLKAVSFVKFGFGDRFWLETQNKVSVLKNDAVEKDPTIKKDKKEKKKKKSKGKIRKEKAENEK